MVIVTLTKNSAKTISRTASSLCEQTYKDVHWIIVDDKSNDSTINTIKEYTNINKTILNGPNQGIFPAYNFALDYLKKKILMILFFSFTLMTSYLIIKHWKM